jgi:hypothetical protein
LQKLYEKYRKQGFSMVAINVNPGQDKDIPAWREKGKYTFPVLVSPANDYARTNYSVPGTPVNLILNSSGKLVFRHLGYGPGGEVSMEAEIRELLGLK